MKRHTSGRGVVCALLTPLTPEGALDAPSLHRLLDFVSEGGVRTVMPGGTTGEGFLLSLDERMELLTLTLEHAGERLNVIAHVGCMDTASTLALARHARDSGAGAVSAIAPYFYTFDEVSLENHFSALAEAVPDIDVYAYTFPGNAKNDLSPTLMRRLAGAHTNIRGIKISNSDLLSVRSHLKGGYDVYCGSDAIALAALTEGAAGQVSGNANVAPGLMATLYDGHPGAYGGAVFRQRELDDLRAGAADGLHPAFYKWLLCELGVIKSATVRQPLRQPTGEEVGQLTALLERLRASDWAFGSA